MRSKFGDEGRESMTYFAMSSHLLHLVADAFLLVARLPWALVEYIRGWLHFRRLANRFPGPPAKPLVGNLLDCGFPKTLSALIWIMEDVLPRYPVGQIWLGPVRFILLNNASDIQIFLKNSNNQSKPDVFVFMLSHIIGKSLLSLNGDQWRLHFKTVQPHFHLSILNTYVAVFNGKCEEMVQNLFTLANGITYDVESMSERLIVDIIYETLLGIPANQQTRADQLVFDYINEGRTHLAHRLTRPWLYHPAIYKLTSAGRKAMQLTEKKKQYLEKIIEHRVKIVRYGAGHFEDHERFKNTLDTQGGIENGSTKIKDTSVIDSLLQEEAKSTIPHDEVVDEVQAMFLGALETTITVFMFALYYLAKNPLVQEKALRELRDIFDAEGSTEVTPQALNRMKYVEMIVKETLRMRAPIPVFARAAGVDTPLVSCDLVVPAGANVLISPQAVHMDPELYPDPHVFDPERFSRENCSKRHPFAFIPFSGGMHYCIGNKFGVMLLKTMVSKIIWNFRVLPDESFEPQLFWALTMGTNNGMRIKFLKR